MLQLTNQGATMAAGTKDKKPKLKTKRFKDKK